MDEGDVVGDAELFQLLEDRELRRSGLIDAAAKMIEAVAEQVEIRAAQKSLRPVARLVAKAFDPHSGAAFPGEAQRVVESGAAFENVRWTRAMRQAGRREPVRQKPRTMVSRSSPASDEWVSQSATLSMRIVKISVGAAVMAASHVAVAGYRKARDFPGP